MSCIHLRKLFQLCQQEQLRLSGTDLVRIICRQCGDQEVCPSLLFEQYEDPVEESESNGTGGSPANETPVSAT